MENSLSLEAHLLVGLPSLAGCCALDCGLKKLITHQYWLLLNCLHSVKVFSLSHSVPTTVSGQEAGRCAAGTADRTCPKDIPYILCHGQQQKLREEEEENNCGEK